MKTVTILVIGSPGELLVALGAEVGRFRERQQVREFGPVRAVAAQAAHVLVAVARVLELRTERVRRVLHLVVARPAVLELELVAEEERRAAAMRIVARGALAGGDRLVLRRRSLLPPDGV